MAFHEVRFPTYLSFGSTGGPERRTDVVTLSNGFEERNSQWSQSRRRYDAGTGLRGLDDIETLIAFFEERRGRLHGFRWKDWSDYRSARPSRDIAATDQRIGTGDGSERMFQLRKTYGTGASKYARTILKPVEGSVRVAVDGVDLASGAASYDTTAGLVVLDSAPGNGAKVTAGFEFDVPVRFDADRIDVSLSSWQAGDVPAIPIVELRLS